MIAILILLIQDALTKKKIAMIMMLVPLIAVIVKMVVKTQILTVTIITLVPMTGVILPQVAITISLVVKTMITVPMTIVTLTRVSPMTDILMSGVLITPLVQLIDVILTSVNVYMNILNVPIKINVPTTVVIPS